MSRQTALILLVLLCLFHLVVNGIYLPLDEYPPSYDPAFHLNISMRIQRLLSEPGWKTPMRLLDASAYYPPLPHLLAALFFMFGGVSPGVAHASQLVWFFLLMGTIWKAGEILFSREAGVLAAALVSLYPIVFGLTRCFYPDLALLALVSLAFLLYLLSEGFTRPGWSLLFGVAIGLGQLAKWTAFLFWGGAVVAFLLPVWVASVSQTQSPVSMQRFLRKALVGYLFSALLFLLALDYLAARTLRTAGGSAIILAGGLILYHVFVGAGMFGLPTLARLRELVFEIWAKRERLRTPLMNLLSALLIGGVICAPWYLRHGPFVLKSTVMTATQDAALRGHPPIASADSFLSYLFYLENHQLHLIFFILLVLALVLAVKYKQANQFPLVFGFLASYLAMSFVQLKDPRFTMPFLYLVALITAGGLMSIKRIALRNTLIGIALIGGVVQLLLISFGMGIEPRVDRIPTRYGDFVLLRTTGYGSAEYIRQNWRLREVVRDLGGQVPPGRSLKVYTLANHHAVHYELFGLYADMENVPLHFVFPPRLENGEVDVRRVYNEADALILKNGGYQGPEFSIRGMEKVTGLLKEPGLEAAFGFRKWIAHPLPDGSTLDVWIRAGDVTGEEGLSLAFGSLGRLLQYRCEQKHLQQGEPALLEVTMEVTPELIENYHLFIHLYGPGKEYLGSFGNAFPVEPQSAVVTMPFSMDTSQALGTGLGQVAIGVWNPETGARLPIVDRHSGDSLGDMVFLKVFLDISENDLTGS